MKFNEFLNNFYWKIKIRIEIRKMIERLRLW